MANEANLGFINAGIKSYSARELPQITGRSFGAANSRWCRIRCERLIIVAFISRTRCRFSPLQSGTCRQQIRTADGGGRAGVLGGHGLCGVAATVAAGRIQLASAPRLPVRPLPGGGTGTAPDGTAAPSSSGTGDEAARLDETQPAISHSLRYLHPSRPVTSGY